jgi:hypothetical protein
MAIWLAMFAAVVELVAAASVYVSVLAPERAPLGLGRFPLVWRLGMLLLLSVLCGATLQLMGVSHRSH